MTTLSLVIGLTPLAFAVVLVPVVWLRQRRTPPKPAVLESREPRAAVQERMRRR